MLEQINPFADRFIAVSRNLQVSPSEDVSRFVLRVAPDKLSAAEKALGGKIPAKIGDLTIAEDLQVACLGPDEWYIWASPSHGGKLQAAFAKLAQKEHLSLVDVSHRETGIDIKGANAEWLLNAASPLNLAEMNAPGAARTIFDRVQIILVKLNTEHYRIEVWDSFADHVWTLLEAASHEVSVGR